ncbi:MAG TPA: DNA-3-methyladenine glycosylase 2 family protein [Candidatus Dormibacteraeota bacterium]
MVTPLAGAIKLRRPLDLQRTLAPLSHGHGDPTLRLQPGEAWRATRTPAGPATVQLRLVGQELQVEAWGEGAAWAAERVPDLVGENDRPELLIPQHSFIADLQRRLPGLRLPRSRAVFETLVPVIIEQKVIGLEARRAYRALLRRFSEPAPGPLPLLLPPAPERIANAPYWEFHPLGIERRRAETLIRAARAARRLEEASEMAPAAALARVTAVPGIGPWSAGHVGLVALGDPDAIPLGDYHLPHLVSWLFTGERRGSDERMLELLAPYAGQRGRVLTLLLNGAGAAPRRGPRLPLRNLAES